MPRTQRLVWTPPAKTYRYFLDTEFTDNGSTIDLISIAMVEQAPDGTRRSYYAVSRDAHLDQVNDWVREHVLPHLPKRGPKHWKPRFEIARDLEMFVRSDVPVEIWAYYASYDWVALCQLFGPMVVLPDHFPKHCLDLKQLSVMLGSPPHPAKGKGRHDALEDASWNAALFEALTVRP